MLYFIDPWTGFPPFVVGGGQAGEFARAFCVGLSRYRIYLNYFRCAHFPNTHTHALKHATRDTHTDRATYTTFHCAYVLGGDGRVVSANVCWCVSVYPVYPLARTEPNTPGLEKATLSSFHEQLNRHNEFRAYWKSPHNRRERALSRLTDFSTTKPHMEPMLCVSEWAQREPCLSAVGWQWETPAGERETLSASEGTILPARVFPESYVLHPMRKI